MARYRAVDVDPPAEAGTLDGLAYTFFTPADPPAGAVVVLHGAGSCKESHYDFCRAARASNLAALAFDARGHGLSSGPMDGRAIDDVGTMAALVRRRLGPGTALALRGSSMGGYFAIVAAAPVEAAAVVAICPAPGSGMARALTEGRFDLDADVPALQALLKGHDAVSAAGALEAPMLLLHAEGDEQVPVEHSREIHAAAPASRLVTMPGGHHRSVQHDPELQALSLRFLVDALRDRGG